MDATVIMFVIAALAIGALIGWLVGSRGSAAGQGVAESLRLQLDGVREERDTHARSIETLRTEHGDLSTRHAASVAAQEERERAFEERLAEINAAKEALGAQFAEVGGKLLESAQKQFLERADQRFKESEATSGNNLKALLQPVHERLQKYEETVSKVESERKDAFGLLTGHIEAMKSGTERVSAEAATLVNALRNAPKARGRWGEQQLRNVLESCGLSEHADFATEVSHTDDEGTRQRPDVIVRIPGGQSLVIDAKVSLNIVKTQTAEVVYSVQGAGEYSLSNREIIGFGVVPTEEPRHAEHVGALGPDHFIEPLGGDLGVQRHSTIMGLDPVESNGLDGVKGSI